MSRQEINDTRLTVVFEEEASVQRRNRKWLHIPGSRSSSNSESTTT